MPHLTGRRVSTLSSVAAAPGLRGHVPRRARVRAPRKGLEDLLETLPDRPELEQLYQRDVPLAQLLRLLGHDVDARQIRDLARCDDPRREIRRLLGNA